MNAQSADVVVIGAGHNGLIAAAYLAAAGQDVLVVERDEVPGGAVSTVERFPGYRVDRGSSAHIMIRHTPIIDELRLTDHGLHYLDCDPWGFAPATADGPAIVLHTDLDRTCASIAEACGQRDADAYRTFVGVWAPRGRALVRAFCGPPGPVAMARAFWGLPTRDGTTGRDAGGMLSREFLQSGDDLLDSWFTCERLKAALAWFGAQSGPPMSEPGTAPMVGYAALLHDMPPGRAVGGSGALTDALMSVLATHGARVRTGCAATAIRESPAGPTVELADGSAVRARRVVAACHVLTTLDLLDGGGFDRATSDRWRRDIVVGNGIGMAVRVAADALPQYAGLPDDLPEHGVHSALGLLVTDRAQLSLAHGQAAAGVLPDRPALVAMSYSAIDPTLAPPGRASLTLWAQWHPRRLAGGRDWSTTAGAATAGVLAEFERHAPGFGDGIRDVYTQTPEDLETELGLRGGNIMHVEMSLPNMFTLRPHPDLAGRRVPGADGVILAGASTHPGGGVNGAAGRAAAAMILGTDTLRSRAAGALRRAVRGRRT
ncbi:phytoene desaturase family protein [Williamsia sterculiae]|uniref:Pyridine nucleotide-disulfide oxidoreductase domain-containing protein 2 n=1 Tax=Williamsia sterculiae TaxID=1344003 RepID=A0A1N7H789_9NOCA|nr:NAD(P)/FAD-dependent oxidoreductase [Williamsia sterculiae]SIS20643.1 Phytoene dehydrogenase-related protein [Williamsia sterculiae]